MVEPALRMIGHAPIVASAVPAARVNYLQDAWRRREPHFREEAFSEISFLPTPNPLAPAGDLPAPLKRGAVVAGHPRTVGLAQAPRFTRRSLRSPGRRNAAVPGRLGNR
jgi:hypothetical protein